MNKVRAARHRLVCAILKYGEAKGQTQWTCGYRTRYLAGRDDDAESERLYQRELAEYKFADVKHTEVERALRAYTVAVRRDMRGKP